MPLVGAKPRRKMGRPPVGTNRLRSQYLYIRLRPDEHAKLFAAIRASGKTATDWARENLLLTAAKELRP